MILKSTLEILGSALVWCSIAEIVTKLTPIPAKMQQIEDSKERAKKYFGLISNMVSSVNGIVGLVLSIYVTARYGVVPGLPAESYHRPPLIVSLCV